MIEDIFKAAEFAKSAHGEQKRKYTDEPYFVHLNEVASIVEDFGADDDVIAAAYLHDVLEDTPTTYEGLAEIFGERVATLVNEVTDVSRKEDGNRKVRKELDRQHLAKASVEGQMIKLADLISNTKSIIEHDEDFAVTYLKEKKALLEVLNKGNSELYEFATKTWREATQKLEMKNGI